MTYNIFQRTTEKPATPPTGIESEELPVQQPPLWANINILLLPLSLIGIYPYSPIRLCKNIGLFGCWALLYLPYKYGFCQALDIPPSGFWQYLLAVVFVRFFAKLLK